ncbi:hypothetical protein [Paenibacillus sp. sgz302251]|uniref:hypothetical protein n=1 Tax=Paenibacillus sp. sgz302251 TaxID=3414493 RepID=UPI003C79DD5A
MDNDRNEPINLNKESSSVTEGDSQSHESSNPHDVRPIFSNSLPMEEEPKKQSGLGIASFILSLVAVILIIVSIVFGVAFADQLVNNDSLLIDTKDEEAVMEAIGQEAIVPIMIAGLSILASIGAAFIGLILGIIGAFSKNRRKVFSVIGIILNGILVLGALGLIVVGLAIGATGAV